MTITYNVYGSDAAGQPIDYVTPQANVSTTTWTSSILAAGTYGFGVRATDANGEEVNLDCSVFVTIDASGNDISNRPAAPIALRAVPGKGGSVRVIWSYLPGSPAAKAPTQFHVYAGAGTPNYAAPVATLAANAAIQGAYSITLTGLTAGTSYAIGVRAANATGEEANTTTVSVTPVATGPLPVSNLTATLTP